MSGAASPAPPPVPKRRSRVCSQIVEGGYICEFVEEPPEVLQTKCPICLLILRSPQLVSCCGNHFCERCIARVLNKQGPCPLCNGSFVANSDKGLARTILGCKVYCNNKDKGCPWTGELRALDKHLGAPDGVGPGMCEFIEAKCTFCQMSFLYHSLATHHSVCDHRPFSCTFCNDYEATFVGVTENHWKVCSKYPVACPNRCGSSFIREDLDRHLAHECLLTSVLCDFHSVGCKTQLQRGDMAVHLADNIVDHMGLLSVHASSPQASQVEMIVPLLISSVAKFAVECQGLQRENIRLRQDLTQLKRTQEKQLLQLDDVTLRLDNATFSGQLPVEFTVPLRDNQQYWFSKPFYTHTLGYKMYIKCACNLTSTSPSNHVEILACLMQGEFDADLIWPFQGCITIQLLNQLSDNHHCTRTFNFYEATHPKITSRVVSQNTAEVGCGERNFIKHSDLGFNSKLNTQFLLHNCLRIRILKVTNISPIACLERKSLQFESFAQAIEPQVSVAPFEFTLNNFRQLQERDSVIYSPAFYTHKKGYKMCLKIIPNGLREAKSTHVSIFSHLMPGLFDACLNWPFNGTISIEIVNQLRDDRHCKMELSYKGRLQSLAGPVVEQERSDAWGFSKFISHNQLARNEGNCQYLKNDSIRICVLLLKK